MAYEWDAFFSYKRDRESDAWHERVKDKLCHWTALELGRPVRIFFDTRDISTGSKWASVISDALRHSRCLLCIWSPLYFRSPWCMSEWMSFVRREEKVGRSLIVPASYFDGSTFPPLAKKTQFTDFSNFASTMPRFWDTDSAVAFEPHLRHFAGDLAGLIAQAPPFDDFPIHEAAPADLQEEADIIRIADV